MTSENGLAHGMCPDPRSEKRCEAALNAACGQVADGRKPPGLLALKSPGLPRRSCRRGFR